VREASLVGTTGRDPNMRSAIALIRSTVDTTANKATVVEQRGSTTRRGNQHMSGGIQSQRRPLSSQAKGKQHENTADEESSSADAFIIGKTPRGAKRSKH
jgi:hypothetical protein